MKFIELKTKIPGPQAREILERRDRAVSAAQARATDVVVERAEGVLVRDVDGNTFMDFAGGIGTLAVGHAPPAIQDAIRSQLDKFLFACDLVATQEPYIRLAELLNEITPGDFEKKTLLGTSGAEAVENAIKIARSYTGRPAVITFEGAYHGRTLLTMSLTSKYELFKKGFGPFAPEIYRVPAPYTYRRPDGLTEDQYVGLCCHQLDNALVAQVSPSAVAAIIIEPIQGEAGFVPMPAAFLEKIRSICNEHGIVMIADEIQSGMGRTGKLFAIEHYGIVPDLITTAKSLGAGMPISAVTGRAEIMDAPHRGGVGGTYGGNPLACVAAIEAVNTIRQPSFLRRAEAIGPMLKETLLGWKERFPLIGDVRGLGPMMLIELVKDRATKEPARDETLQIIRRAVSKGLIVIRAGLHSNCIRFMPPLIITDEQLAEGLSILETAIQEHIDES